MNLKVELADMASRRAFLHVAEGSYRGRMRDGVKHPTFMNRARGLRFFPRIISRQKFLAKGKWQTQCSHVNVFRTFLLQLRALNFEREAHFLMLSAAIMSLHAHSASCARKLTVEPNRFISFFTLVTVFFLRYNRRSFVASTGLPALHA